MAVDMFLKITGVDGGSTDTFHQKWIDILSFSWGVTQGGSAQNGSGGGAGKVAVHDLSISKYIDKATPALMNAACQGQHFPDAVLAITPSPGDTQGNTLTTPVLTDATTSAQGAPFLVFKLSDLIISGYNPGASQGDTPMESVSLNFAKIEITYNAPDGEQVTGSC